MEVKSLRDATDQLKAGFPSLQADINAFMARSPTFDEDPLELTPQEEQELKNILVSIILELVSKAKSKQDRVDILQRVLLVDGLLKVYWLFNYAPTSSLRRLAGCLLYYLIGDSKELAKYLYDKVCKKLFLQDQDAYPGVVLKPSKKREHLMAAQVTLNMEIPELSEQSANLPIVQDQLKLESKKPVIFWFSAHNYAQVRDQLMKVTLHMESLSANTSQSLDLVETICSQFLLTFPDSEETLMGLNLFYNVRQPKKAEAKELKSQKAEPKQVTLQPQLETPMEHHPSFGKKAIPQLNSGSRTQREYELEDTSKLLEMGDGQVSLAVSMFEEAEKWGKTKDNLTQSIPMSEINNELLKKTSVMKKLNKPEIILNSHTHYPPNMNRYLDHNPFSKNEGPNDDLSQYLSQTIDQTTASQPNQARALNTVTYFRAVEDRPISKTAMGTRLPFQATIPSTAQSSMLVQNNFHKQPKSFMPSLRTHQQSTMSDRKFNHSQLSVHKDALTSSVDKFLNRRDHAIRPLAPPTQLTPLRLQQPQVSKQSKINYNKQFSRISQPKGFRISKQAMPPPQQHQQKRKTEKHSLSISQDQPLFSKSKLKSERDDQMKARSRDPILLDQVASNRSGQLPFQRTIPTNSRLKTSFLKAPRLEKGSSSQRSKEGSRQSRRGKDRRKYETTPEMQKDWV